MTWYQESGGQKFKHMRTVSMCFFVVSPCLSISRIDLSLLSFSASCLPLHPSSFPLLSNSLLALRLLVSGFPSHSLSPSLHLSVYHSIYLSVSLSLRLSIYCLSTYPFLCFFDSFGLIVCLIFLSN